MEIDWVKAAMELARRLALNEPDGSFEGLFSKYDKPEFATTKAEFVTTWGNLIEHFHLWDSGGPRCWIGSEAMAHLVFQGMKAQRFKPLLDEATAGAERVTFDIYIDYAALEALAIRAAGNRSGKQKSGAVQVVITGRRLVAGDVPTPIVPTSRAE